MDEWGTSAWVIQETTCAVSMEAFTALACAGKHEIAPDEGGLRKGDLRIFAELFDIVGNARRGDALSILRGMEGSYGVYAWSELSQKYSPKAMVGRIPSP